MATTPGLLALLLGKKPDVLLGSMTALPEKTPEVELGGKRAIGWFTQWYRSSLVAWPQCWLPATTSVGLSVRVRAQSSREIWKANERTLVIEVVGSVRVAEQAVRVVHDFFFKHRQCRKRKASLAAAAGDSEASRVLRRFVAAEPPRVPERAFEGGIDTHILSAARSELAGGTGRCSRLGWVFRSVRRRVRAAPRPTTASTRVPRSTTSHPS